MNVLLRINVTWYIPGHCIHSLSCCCWKRASLSGRGSFFTKYLLSSKALEIISVPFILLFVEYLLVPAICSFPYRVGMASIFGWLCSLVVIEEFGINFWYTFPQMNASKSSCTRPQT